MNNLNILELAVIHTSIQERLERLTEMQKADSDIKLKGEIDISLSLIDKIKTVYISKGGDINWL